ncbi:MAG: tRNA (N6-isopentenyl adenosine(37)-C2)-methylthiotransferase MiaB [Bacilli bacterium]|nr:tRNA (N6-isopentenyl adenosine(37)-C2)-methylthiotransferase MiaB [Bacilli bacterium]MBO6285754.1 tRNA (N6-isopentenyl adenosine(37)-C2)-methylthiotransferase MiaB [Bacilli bacterium]
MAKKIYKSVPDMSKARNRVDLPILRRDEIVIPAELKRFAEGKKYWICTFGCQANVRDEEIMAGYLELAGYTKASNEAEANIAIVNTCAVRENAEEKVYGEIGKYKANHLKDKDFILAVCGCMMQEEGVAKTLMERYPYINLIFGTHNVPDLLNLLDDHLKHKKDYVDVHSFPGDIIENLPSTRLDEYKAFVNITYGCDKFCTYCIVPYTRGRERSRLKEDVVAECKALVEDGFQEITLLGQNVNSYGKDFHDGTSFASILEEVAKLGIPRLRFMTSHPWDFSDEMLDVIAKYPNIMHCIHLPVQSGSDEVLRQMGRRYGRKEYLDLVRRIREKIPDCAITTDIIVGFPNETEEQFLDTLSLCQEVRYDAAFTFIYSPRKGTPAARMVDNVSDADKHERFMRLVKVVEQGVESHAAEMLGKTYKVLVDGPSKKDPTMLSGYTESSKLVHFKGPASLRGHIVDVRITESHTFSMIGELTEDAWITLAKDLSASLKENEEVSKRYFECKKACDEDKSVALLQEKISVSQKEMMRLASAGDDAGYLHAKKEYEAAKRELESHPLVQNKLSAYEELRELLLSVAKELS